MMRSRLGLKALGLCALLVGAMAVVSGVAQAETGSHWNVSGTSISSSLLPELKVTELEFNDLTLLSELSSKKVELLCAGMAFTNVKLGAEGAIDTGGGTTLTGCIFKWGGVEQKKCLPHSKGDPEGTIKTMSFHGLIQLGEAQGNALLLPDTSQTFQTIILGKEGELNECAAGEKLPVSGELSVKDSFGFSTEQITHLIVEAPVRTNLWILNKTTEHKVLVDGSAVIALTGAAHEGLKWSGTPN